LIFGRSLGIGMPPQTFSDPLVGCFAGEADQLAVDDGTQDISKLDPGDDQIGDARIEVAEFAVAHYYTVVRIVEDKAVRDCPERRLDHATLTIAFVGQSGPLHDALAKESQRPRHHADLIARRRWDRSAQVTGRNALHSRNDLAQRDKYRAKDHEGRRNP